MLFHGVPINAEIIAVAFGILVWIIQSIARGLRQIARPALPPVQTQAPLPPQNGSQFSDPPQVTGPVQRPPAPFSSAQTWQQQAARGEQGPTSPRQPSADGPAVLLPASSPQAGRQEFVRQEQEPLTAEPRVPGVSRTAPPAAAPNAFAPNAFAPNALFGGTDDLVRAIILQEVLGPPLSRRRSPP